MGRRRPSWRNTRRSTKSMTAKPTTVAARAPRCFKVWNSVFCAEGQSTLPPRSGGAQRRTGLPVRQCPTLQVFGGNARERLDPFMAFIQARNVAQLCAAGLEVSGLVLDADLLQRFQAIRNEARADHVQPAGLALAEFLHCLQGIGLQPFGTPETGLERDLIALRCQAEFFAQQPRRLVALAVIRVAAVERETRQAVEAHEQLVGTAVGHPVIVYALRQRGNVGGVIVIML